MHRRGFLRGTAAATLGLAMRPGAGTAAIPGAPRPAFTILTDIDPWQHGPVLARVLAAFAEAGLPVACLMNLAPGPDGQPATLPPDQPPAALVLARAIDRTPALVEPLAWQPDLLALPPHAMARAAHEAGKATAQALWPSGERPLSALFPAIACAENATPMVPEGIRAAGFRTCLVIPPRDQPARGERWANGTLRIFGGSRADWHTPPGAPPPDAPTAFAEIRYLSLADLAALPPERAGALARAHARQQLQREQAGEIALLALSDMVLRDDFGFEHQIALHLLRPAAADAALHAGYLRLRADLVRLGFPFSESSAATTPPELALWLPGDSTGPAPQLPPLKIDDTPTAQGVPPAGADQTTPGFALRLSLSRRTSPGVDATGALNIPAHALPTVLRHRQLFLGGALSSHDFALVIGPQEAASARSRARVLRLLMALDRDGVTTFRDLAAHARSLYPQGPLIARYQHTQAYLPAIHTGKTRPPGTAGHQALMADARRAWSYIAAYTHPKTGLCASVVETTGGITRLETVTMWDVASHLNALPAAQALGLIDRAGMQARISAILPNITGRETDGRRLPSEWIRTDRVHYGNRNFDACDTGRLLAALWNLKAVVGPELARRIDDLVAGWDLDKILIDGELHSVTDGQLGAITASHCAHYAARGFRLWGHAPRSPYEVFERASVTDDRMRLLHRANAIGVIGAEPLLLEGCDLGLSPESSYLADVLLAAQIAATARTGLLYGVSETPLDRPPWFSYQGLVLDRLRDEWRVVGIGAEEGLNTPAFQRENLVLSCKAAYLWAAIRPHEYSDRLVDFVRQNGTSKTGFVSGIYMTPQRPMTNYTDLNTNAIILQAIARILRKS